MKLTPLQHECLAGLGLTLALAVLLCVAILVASGCKALQFGKAGIAPDIVHGQTPGVATGAGATLAGPANSGAPSTQVAERRTKFYPAYPAPRPDLMGARYGQPAKPDPDSPVAAPAAAVDPVMAMPDWSYERTETTLGAHQDAAGIVKMAATLSSWSTLRWMGALCLAVCIGGLLWSHGNPEGYPLVFWKVGGCGVFFLLAGDNPAWLLLLIFPLGFYAAQKLNLLKLP